MKLLAILYDSYREAVDGKVFYALMGIWVFLFALLLSLTFRPLPPEEAFKAVVKKFRSVYERDTPHRVHSMSPKYEVFDVAEVEGSAQPPAGTYRFRLQAGLMGFAQSVSLWHFGMPSEPSQLIREEAMKPEIANAFLADQFLIHGGMDAEASLTTVDERNVSFDVTVRVDDPRGWLYQPSVLFGAVPVPRLIPFEQYKDTLGRSVYDLEDVLVNRFGSWILLLASIIVTAFFVPNMLQKGTIEPLLVRPIHRVTLLLYKYLGGLIFVLLNISVAVVGVWIALGLRTGIWATGFLLSIPLILYFFAVFYSVSVLVGVVTRSAVLAILATYICWFLIFSVGLIHGIMEPHFRDLEKANAGWLPTWRVIHRIHYVLPRTHDLDAVLREHLQQDTVTEGERRGMRKVDVLRVDLGESLLVSAAFIAVMLGLSCWWFATKDF